MATNKLKKILFLDDRSKRIHSAFRKYSKENGYDLTACFTAKECIKMLSNEGPWDIVSLDHDLCFEEFQHSFSPLSGMEVVRWVREYYRFFEIMSNHKFPEFIIHSSNKAAAFNMHAELEKIGMKCKVERYEYE